MTVAARSSAGSLSRRIVIKAWSDTPNAAFGLDQTFTTALTRWARHEPVHGLAIRAGMQTGEAPTDLFWVRYGAGTRPHELTAGHVVEFNSRRYRILDAIDVDGLHVFTRITAKDLGAI
jgi:head-tail adaptor